MNVGLFDIDGTLLSSGGAGRAAMETALLEEFGLSRLEGRVEFSGRTDRAIGRDLFRLHGIEDCPANWERFLAAYLRRLPACLARHQGQVLPGIANLLQHLGGAGRVALGLLTGNTREGARLKLGHYGLAHHFHFGGYGDHHLDRCDVAREALDDLRRYLRGPVCRERIWVVGDTPLDIRCARAIGVRVAAVATGWHSLDELAAEGPDLLLRDLSDPTPLLKVWS
ncbi:MAG TPA: HAD family hydrolase [Gemmataceae bacterium]|nr:HAD family hydrolase [Gemmataceae bacterium]